MSKTMLTIFVDTNVKKLLREIADIEDEIHATYELNRKGVSGLLEPVITEWVEDYLDDLQDWMSQASDIIEDV